MATSCLPTSYSLNEIKSLREQAETVENLEADPDGCEERLSHNSETEDQALSYTKTTRIVQP